MHGVLRGPLDDHTRRTPTAKWVAAKHGSMHQFQFHFRIHCYSATPVVSHIHLHQE